MPRRLFLEIDRENFTACWTAGMRTETMSRRFRLSYPTVLRWAAEFGLPPRKRVKKPKVYTRGPYRRWVKDPEEVGLKSDMLKQADDAFAAVMKRVLR